MNQRLGASEEDILVVRTNLANMYSTFGRHEQAMRMRKDAYSGYLRLYGEHINTCLVAKNYAMSLLDLQRYGEAKSVLSKTIPVVQRIRGRNDAKTLKMRWSYAMSLCADPAATLDDLREAVATLEDAERIARRVFGGAHPLAMQMEHDLKKARAKLRAHEIAEAMLATTLGDAA